MSEAKKFRKKPVEIEAVQFDGNNDAEVLDWMTSHGYHWEEGRFHPGEKLIIVTLEGNMKASTGDWIIRGVQGEFYPCKPDIFEATYEETASDQRN